MNRKMIRVGARHRFESGWNPKGFGDQDLRLPPELESKPDRRAGAVLKTVRAQRWVCGSGPLLSSREDDRIGIRRCLESSWNPFGFEDRDLCLPPTEQLGIGEPTGL